MARVNEHQRGMFVQRCPDGPEGLIAEQLVAVGSHDDNAIGLFLDLENVPDLLERALDVIEIRQACKETKTALALAADVPDLIVESPRQLSASLCRPSKAGPGAATDNTENNAPIVSLKRMHSSRVQLGVAHPGGSPPLSLKALM